MFVSKRSMIITKQEHGYTSSTLNTRCSISEVLWTFLLHFETYQSKTVTSIPFNKFKSSFNVPITIYILLEWFKMVIFLMFFGLKTIIFLISFWKQLFKKKLPQILMKLNNRKVLNKNWTFFYAKWTNICLFAFKLKIIHSASKHFALIY